MGYSNVVHPILAIKTVTFDGTAGTGATGDVPIFTVTSEILVVALVPFCTTSLTEAAGTATIVLGVTGDTNLFNASLNAVDIDGDEFWVDTAPDPDGIALPAALKDIVITGNILATVATQAVNGGIIRFSLYWLPLSSTSNVVAA